MANHMFMYPNYSKGGVSAVLRGRASHDTDSRYLALFDVHRGGDGVFDNLPNVSPRVVRKDRQEAYIKFAVDNFSFEQISILSNPDAVKIFSTENDAVLNYEIHSSDMKIVDSELAQLDAGRVDEFIVPSEYMASRVARVASSRIAKRLKVKPNLIDATVFHRDGDATYFGVDAFGGSRDVVCPLLWVGRFDKGKGYTYFLRTLALLPERFQGVCVVSLESDPQRMVAFLAEAAALGVSHRVSVHSDLSPRDLADMFRSAATLGGYLVSTSLLESFGYSVAEAMECGLSVRAFDLPVWIEHAKFGAFGKAVPPGDVGLLADSIRE